MRVTVLQHVPHEGPGLIASAARSAQATLDHKRFWAGDRVPPRGTFDALVVLGGPMAVNDDSAYPHLGDEIRLLAACAERGIPVLAIGLGAQLLARALRAQVGRGPLEEVGIGNVSLTSSGLVDPVLGGAGPDPLVFHKHHDTFELPSGATHLARNSVYPNQAFRAGGCLYGLQFHVELDRQVAATLEPRLPQGVRLDLDQVDRVAKTGHGVLKRFFEYAASVADHNLVPATPSSAPGARPRTLRPPRRSIYANRDPQGN